MLPLKNLKRSIWIGLLFIVQSLIMAFPSAAQDFTIVVLPDTQYYSQSYPATFSDQTQWIVDNIDALNIVYVAHEGDIVNTASSTVQWDNAVAAMSLMENPVTTGLPDGIPYGVIPGNHDEPTTFYNQYFGVDRFCNTHPTDCRSYYGSGYPFGSNDNNYILFTAGGLDFIVINLEYVDPAAGVLNWADQLLKDNNDRRAIIVSHKILNIDGSFGSWGHQIYDALKDNSNLFLMLCGHVHGEAMRVEEYDGNTVHILLADYQDLPNGGNGWLRIMEFSPENDEITVTTYSPSLDQYGTDPVMGDDTTSEVFTISYDMTNWIDYPVPDIKANGLDGSITISTLDTLSVKVTLQAGDLSSINCDWWCVAQTPWGWYSYEYAIGQWLAGFRVTHEGHCADLSTFEVMNMTLPDGEYIFYFGVDNNMNGSWDGNQYYESVNVTVEP